MTKTQITLKKKIQYADTFFYYYFTECQLYCEKMSVFMCFDNTHSANRVKTINFPYISNCFSATKVLNEKYLQYPCQVKDAVCQYF